jgi:hypothetical protein
MGIEGMELSRVCIIAWRSCLYHFVCVCACVRVCAWLYVYVYVYVCFMGGGVQG